jgi:hypothetical protein
LSFIAWLSDTGAHVEDVDFKAIGSVITAEKT